jgi:hypothetical protein
MAREIADAGEFCISVLEEVRTPESVFTLLAIGVAVIEQPESDIQLAVRMAEPFNRLLFFQWCSGYRRYSRASDSEFPARFAGGARPPAAR